MTERSQISHLIRRTTGRTVFFTDLGAVIVRGHRLTLAGAEMRTHTVPSDGGSADLPGLMERSGVVCGVASFPDGDRVVYVYDIYDRCFGYAWNIDRPECSQWGFAPFAGDEDDGDWWNLNDEPF